MLLCGQVPGHEGRPKRLLGEIDLSKILGHLMKLLITSINSSPASAARFLPFASTMCSRMRPSTISAVRPLRAPRTDAKSCMTWYSCCSVSIAFEKASNCPLMRFIRAPVMSAGGNCLWCCCVAICSLA